MLARMLQMLKSAINFFLKICSLLRRLLIRTDLFEKKFPMTFDFSLSWCDFPKLHFFPAFSSALCIQRLSVPKLFGSFCRNPKNRKPKTTKSFSLLALTFVQSFQTVGYVFHVPNPEQNKDAAGCYVKNKIFFFWIM